MKNLKNIQRINGLILIMFLMVSFSFAGKQEHFTLQKEADYFKVETKAWVLESWASKTQTRHYAKGISTVYENLYRILDLNAESSNPVKIKILENKNAFWKYVKKDRGEIQFIGGFFSEEKNEIVVWHQSLKHTLPILAHELTHAVIYQVMKHPPLWFNEGFAEYIGLSQIRWGKFKKVSLDESYMKLILESDRAGTLIPLSKLISLESYLDGHMRKLQYAQAWGLIYFLFHGSGEKERISFFNYIQALKTKQGVSLERFISLDFLEEVWLKELKSLAKKKKRSNIPDL